MGLPVVPLLVFGLALIAVAIVPALRRAPLLLPMASAVTALVADSITSDGFVVVASGALPVLAGLVLREISATFDLLAAPRREARKVARNERLSFERGRVARERERRRQARERERLAA